MADAPRAGWERRLHFAALVALLATAAFHAVLVSRVWTGFDLAEFIQAADRAARHGWPAAYDYRAVATGQPFVDLPLVLGIAALLEHARPFVLPLWTAISVACLLGAVLLVARDRLIWAAAVLSSIPVAHAIATGQMSGVILLTLAVAAWLISRGRLVAAGLALAIALQLKPTETFLVALALLAARQWRLLASYVVSGAAIAAVYLIVLGPGFPLVYLHAAQHAAGALSTGTATVGYTLPMVGPLGGDLIRLPLLALVVLAAARMHSRLMVLAVGLLGSLVVSPYVQPYDLTPLLLVGMLIHREQGGRRAALLTGPIVVLWNLSAWPAAVALLIAAEVLALLVLALGPEGEAAVRARLPGAAKVHAGLAGSAQAPR